MRSQRVNFHCQGGRWTPNRLVSVFISKLSKAETVGTKMLAKMLVSSNLAIILFTGGGVPDHPLIEPSYEEAVARWPDTRRPITFLGLKDHPDEFAVMWNGDLSLKTFVRTDTDRQVFGEKTNESLQVSFSIGEKPNFNNRDVEDGSTQPSLAEDYLPITRVRLQKGDIVLQQEAFASDEKGRGSADAWSAPAFLRVRFTVEAAGHGDSPIRLWAQMAKSHISYSMETRRNVRIEPVAPLYPRELRISDNSLLDSRGLIVMSADRSPRFYPELPADLNSLALRETQLDRNLCEFTLRGSTGATLDLIFPFTPVSADRIAPLLRLSYEQVRQTIAEFWRGEIAHGMQVEVPEQPLNNLWRSSVPLAFITADAYPNGDRVLKLSPHHYEASWPTPMAMQLQELMQRGYLKEVAAYLEPFLDATRRRPVPSTGSSFAPTSGFVSGPSGHVFISWVSDHGAVLWAASEYYLLTRDQKFLDHWISTMLAGVEWIAHERELTKLRGGVGAGLMPAGRATDDDKQANFVWSDAWVYRGLDAVCRVLKAINHKDASRWVRERDDYRATFERIFRDQIQRTIRWRNPSGEEIPFIPYELSQTSADHLHPFYLDTGPMFLGVAGLVDPRDETMTWAMKWLTEGPDSTRANPDWTDFSDRPSLRYEMSSVEPCYSWNIYLRFLRNERLKFLEGFYSLAAGAVSRRFLGGVETRDGIQAMPAMNAVINNHLKNILLFEENGA
ncbi:MAG TPA: hypothetical protein DHV65_12535 [Ktedonobacter sp.]|nr:hypothetical protein [Ktedonobacter sp.]